MKKRLIPIALVMGALSANAQVGIGTATPNKSAELTVEAKNRGLLIPNVSLLNTKDTKTITNGNVNSLLVFNTTTNEAITPGYYYWFVDKWERLTADSDIPAIVVNNFENILHMDGDKVTNLIKNIVKTTEGNVIYEGDKLYYINDDGDKVEINFGDVVAANESKTVIVSTTNKKQQYYLSEAYLQVNDTPTQAVIDAWTAGNLPDGVYSIDVVGGVVNNFEEVVNEGPVNVDGRTFPTINDYITYLTESTGGFTKIVYDATTGDAIFQEWDEATQTWVNVNNAKFKTIVAANESKTTIVSNTSKKQQYYVSEAYLQTNEAPTQAIIDAWTAGTVPAGVYPIDVVGGVVNNFQEFVQKGPITVDGRTYPTINDYITYVTESTGGFTKIIYDSENRNASFQQWDEATQQWVNVINSKFKKIITDNESQTTIITVEGKQYYISEEYLAANGGVVPTTVDPTALPAGIYAIDVVGGVVNNFEEIVNNGPINVDGTTYQTINDYLTHVTQTTGGFTKIVYDETTGDVIFQEWDASTNSWVNVDNSKFETIVQANESQTTIITVEGKQYYISEEYLAANGGVVPTTVDPTALPAGIYAIDVVGGVVNNFEEIVNNGPINVDGTTYQTINDYLTHVTQTTGGFTKIVYDETTGDVIFQEWDASTNSWVNVDNSKFETIVQANESQTTIITVEGKQYYISEEYLAANGGVAPTTVDPTALPAGIYAIDVVGGVVNNFEEIVNNGPINVDGTTYQTINDYLTHVTQTTGGFTKIVYDETTGDVIFQEWDASTNSWVNVDNSKFETIVQANESQTTIITVDGKQYYISEEYLAANGGVAPTTVDPTALPAGIYAIDVVGGVVNNFEEIVNNGPINVDGTTYQTINDYITHLTETTGGFTKIVYDATTGDAIFQEWDETEQKWVNVENTKFKTIVQDNESQTTIITVDGKQYYISEEYLAANGGLVPATVDATSLPAGIYEIDVVGGVVNNFEEIVNNGPINVDGTTYQTINDYITHLTETTGGFTKIVYDATTGDAIFQEWDETEQKWVNVENTKFKTIVQDNESQTTIITVDGKQYYISEEYLAANGGLVPATVDVANLPAGIYAIDVVGGVVNNFEEIVNNGPINVDGTTYQTINDYITHLTETTGGFTKIVYDATTGDAIFQEWDETEQKWVNVENTKFKTIVQDNESQTTIITVEGKQYYISEEYLAANGGLVPATVDAANLPAGIYEIDVVGGVVNNFEEIVNEGPITVDGRTYPTINDYLTYVSESTGGFTKIVYDATTGDAIFQEWNETEQKWVNVENTKFKTIVQDNESQTTIITVDNKQYYVSEEYLVNNGGKVPATVDADNLPAGIYAIDVVGGVVNNFEEIVNEGPITVDGRTYPTINDYLTYVSESTGGFTKIVYDATTGDAIFQEWNETEQKWVNVENTKFKTIVQANESQTTIITVDGKQYYISEEYLAANGGLVPATVDAANLPAGIYAIDVVGGVVNNFEEIVNEGPITVDGRTYPTINDYLTYVSESTGGFTKIVYDATTGDAIFQEWNETEQKWVNVDNSKFETIVRENETTTLLVKNADGTFTYYNEEAIDADGNGIENKGVTIDPKEVSVALNTTTNKYEFKNSKDEVIGEIDANAGAIAFDNSENGFVSKNVQDALEELKNSITTVEGTKGDLKVTGGLLKIDAGGEGALRHDATVSLNLSNLNSIKEVEGVYDLTLEDVVLLGNAGTMETVINLPEATPENKGKKYTIKKHDGNEDNYVTVKGNIAGASELYTALPYSGWDLVSDGAIWQIVNKF